MTVPLYFVVLLDYKKEDSLFIWPVDIDNRRLLKLIKSNWALHFTLEKNKHVIKLDEFKQLMVHIFKLNK
jgi:hypothetical protein